MQLQSIDNLMTEDLARVFFRAWLQGTHTRWRTPYEHDVLLPQAMKDQGVPFTPSWNKMDPLPDSVAIRLKPVRVFFFSLPPLCPHTCSAAFDLSLQIDHH